MVILLKAESKDDFYGRVLRNLHMEPIYITPSKYVFKNLNILRSKLQDPHKYAGIVLMGPRCVEAVRQALDNKPIPACWRPLSNYALGRATQKSAYYSLHNLPTVGNHAASAHNLCDLIVETFGPKRELPFLLPCGDMTCNTLRHRLVTQGFRVDACEIFESQCHPQFNSRMKQALKSKKMETIVFFSPASVKMAAEFFEKYKVSLNDRKLIAVGSITQKAMLKAGLKVSRMMEHAAVEQFVQAVKN